MSAAVIHLIAVGEQLDTWPKALTPPFVYSRYLVATVLAAGKAAGMGIEDLTTCNPRLWSWFSIRISDIRKCGYKRVGLWWKRVRCKSQLW